MQNLENMDIFEILNTQKLLICPKDPFVRSALICILTADDTVKPVLCSLLKRRPKIGFHDQLSLNAGQKYCRMLQGEHSAILSTFIQLPYVKIFVLLIESL